MANSVGPDHTAPIGAVCSGSALFASILNSSVMLGNYLQQTTSAANIFRCIFLDALRVKIDFVISQPKFMLLVHKRIVSTSTQNVCKTVDKKITFLCSTSSLIWNYAYLTPLKRLCSPN